MKTTEISKYFTNGEINDPHFTGITIAEYSTNENGDMLGGMFTEDGKPFFGYKPNEITKEKYEEWKEIIRNPDLITYFPGIFPGRGVIDKDTYDLMIAEKVKLYNIHLQKEVEKNKIGFLISQKDAKSINQDHELVFRNYYPTVSEDVIKLLFNKE